jgi:LysM repeat protein
MVTLAFALSSVFGLWRVSTASLPGDLTYPIKAWVTMMNLSMTSPELRAQAAQANAAEIQSEFAESARRAQEKASTGAQIDGVTHQESVFLVFEGYDGRLLKFGDIRVLPSYQPDPADEARQPMEVEGNLQPGAQVWLTVQILPGQADIVQGVRAEVQDGVPSAEKPATPVACTSSRPAGWVSHTVRRGDTLSALSQASGATVREIAGANCLDSEAIFAGQLLFLPAEVAPD